jgi:hypothetical protein
LSPTKWIDYSGLRGHYQALLASAIWTGLRQSELLGLTWGDLDFDDLGQFARFRMEFLKRICTWKYGIYDRNVPTPISGVVHVYGVTRNGAVRQYVKGRDDARTIIDGRA